MRMKTQRILAALLCLVLLLALAPAGWAVDFEQACSITVLPAAPDVKHEDGTAFVDDINASSTHFVYDLYRVAYAKEVPGYDTYDYTLVGPFEKSTEISNKIAGDPTQRNAEFWADLAQQAAKIALAPNEGTSQITPIGYVDESYSGNEMGTPLSLPGIEVPTGEGTEATTKTISAGLYLVITRSTDFLWNKMSGYVIEKDNDVSTLAHTDLWDYYYAPQLISIPTKEPIKEGEEDIIKTSNPGDWDYTPTAVLKPTSMPRNGDLKIRKVVNEVVDGKEYAGTKATFAYRVEAKLNEKLVYDNICEITIPDQQEVIIKNKIPVGAVVTVSELYDGSRYKYKDSRIVVSGDGTNATLVINSSEENPATIEFTNDNDGTPKEGYGILNTFIYNGSKWVWTDEVDVPVQEGGGVE